MGLFGGFKANFTSRLRKKKKEEGVVCLKYIVNSEFDDVRHTSTHAESTTKPKRPVIKSLYLENSNGVQPSLPRSQSVNQINSNRENHEYEYPVQSKNAEATNSRLTEKPGENFSSKNPDETTTNSLYIPSSSSLEMKLNQEDIYDGYEVVTPVEEHKTIVSDSKKQDNSTPVLMTQRCLEEGEKNVENGEDNFETNIQAVQLSEDNEFPKLTFKIKDPEEQFQVHLVQTESNRDYSCSEEELSENEEEISEYTSMGYSSQAASIFFGEDEKPKVSRPRRIIFSGDGPDEDEC